MTDTAEPASSDHPRSLNRQLTSLKQIIWNRRPILGEIMGQHGDSNLYRYAQGFLDVAPNPKLDYRKRELIDTARDLIAERLGDRVADDVAQQLTQLPLVSTTDHHGPIDHPFFVNANIISGIPFLEHTERDLRHLVVFSFASVSVNNASAYPRGILFHGGDHGEGELIRLPILPDKAKMGVVHGVRPMTRADIDRAGAQLTEKEKTGLIGATRAQRIRDILERYFATSEILRAKDFASQISIINYHLWPRLFSPTDPKAPTDEKRKLPDLVYLEIETLVTELLIQRHFRRTDSPLTKLLFDPIYHQSALKHFNNISGAFSLEKNWGTFLFWALDEKLRRVRLMLDGQTLRSLDGHYTFPLEADAIATALREKKIFPSMILCYLVVALHYGMKCLGGFSQVHDLTMAKQAWAALLREQNNPAEAEAIAPIQTKVLGGDGMVLAYLKTASGHWYAATGVDLAIAQTDTTLQRFVELAKRVTLAEMMDPMLPEMYSVLYSLEERDPELARIVSEEIIHANGLRRKIQATLEESFPSLVLEQKATITADTMVPSAVVQV